ncbi:MAG: hypothetical protein PHI98_10210 [Eubacteriales bacterium]|nr:hypothetical protein [Eubacteriales bacterium]
MKAVQSYLNQIAFPQTWKDLEIVEKRFLAALQGGLKGSGLPMLPAYLSVEGLEAERKEVIVMDAGGTNLRVALIGIQTDGKPEILYQHKQPVPGKESPLSKDDFFMELAKAVKPVADRSDCIGFCFSFPCTIKPDYDGQVIYMDKEITVEGIDGAFVAKELREALRKLGVNGPHRIVVLNDTTAALLGALAEHHASYYGGHIGMILGTGVNCCYEEMSQQITKDAYLQEKAGGCIVNTECGTFSDIPLTAADVALSQSAKAADQNLLEKMISGAYQGVLLKAMLQGAAEAGVFTEECKERIFHTAEIESRDVSAFMELPLRYGKLNALATDEADRLAVYELTDAMLNRAAMLSVLCLTAIMTISGKGHDPLRPVLIAIEGTTYEKNQFLRKKLQAMLSTYTEKERGFYTRLVSTENVNMIGSAMAALAK